MEIVVWLAFAVILTADGAQVVNAGVPMKTRAECEKLNVTFNAELRKHERFSEIIGLGVGCAPVTVKSLPQAAKPRPTQKDLERPKSDTQPSTFREARGA